VAIDSCVARRPPALKASAEDAAVERLAQLLLSVPDVSRSLLQQLLANIKRSRAQCSRLTLDGAADDSTTAPGSQDGVQGGSVGSRQGSYSNSIGGAATAGAGAGSAGGSADSGPAAAATDSKNRVESTLSGAAGAAAGNALVFSDADIARFEAGLKKCLTGVLQIKVRFSPVLALCCCYASNKLQRRNCCRACSISQLKLQCTALCQHA
jgi:hypothetical protein